MGRRRLKLSYRKNLQSAYHRKRAQERQKKRAEQVQQSLLLAASHETQSGFEGFDVPPLKQGIRVLSLFDGISSALHVLDKMHIHVEAYFSSEIDQNALKLQRHRFGERVIRLGSVTDLTDEILESLGTIHLLIGGSPCSDLSLVNPRRRGLTDPSSTGILFYEYVRIKKFMEAKAAKVGEEFFWLFENTFHMEVSTRETISRSLGSIPVVKDASQYLPVKRRRSFWGNLPGMEKPPEPDHTHNLNDVLAPHRHARVKVVPTLTTSTSSERSGKDKRLPVIEDGEECPLFITEVEKLFGLPESFTDGPNLSLTDRRRLLGKSFCIPVVQDLMTPLIDRFWVKP